MAVNSLSLSMAKIMCIDLFEIDTKFHLCCVSNVCQIIRKNSYHLDTVWHYRDLIAGALHLNYLCVGSLFSIIFIYLVSLVGDANTSDLCFVLYFIKQTVI